MSFKINLFYPILVILLLITLIKPQIPNPEESNPPSHVHNESEYYNDSIFEDMNIEDETPTEADNKEDNKDEEEEDEDDKNIMKEWEEYMHDFVPADMLTYEIEGFQREHFFEDINEIPSYIRGAYFVSSEDKGKIDFYVIDPKNHTIQTKLDKREGLFYFNATKKGVYTFMFCNLKGEVKKQITFAIHCGNSTDQLLKNEHLSPLQSRIMSIENRINARKTFFISIIRVFLIGFGFRDKIL